MYVSIVIIIIKPSARWVPHLLKDFKKEPRVQELENFCCATGKKETGFLNRIITTDEMWMWLYDPEMKGQSTVWNQSGFPPLEKAQVTKLGGKHMFIMFFDR